MVSGSQPLRCVIVDDNAAFLDAAANMLTHEGLTVVGVATNSAEALHSVAELRPDITLVDIHLGGESGFDLAEQLAPAGSAVILTSTHSEQDFGDMVAASTALGFVPKVELSADAVLRILGRGNGSSD